MNASRGHQAPRKAAELPVLCSSFPLAICFTYGNVYISLQLSRFIPPSLSPTGSISLFFMSKSLFLPCKQVDQYHFSRFHIYALIYNICFSLSDFTLYNRPQIHEVDETSLLIREKIKIQRKKFFLSPTLENNLSYMTLYET